MTRPLVEEAERILTLVSAESFDPTDMTDVARDYLRKRLRVFATALGANGHDPENIGKSKLKPIELNQFLDLPIPEPKPLLGPILRAGSLVMIHGPAGSTKTYTMLGMGLAISHGTEHLGWSAPTPTPVLYIDGEMPAHEMQQRVRKLTIPIWATIAHPWAAFLIITPDLQSRGIQKIDSPEGQAELLHLIDDRPGLGCVFLDNLSCLSDPQDDNSASSWSAVQELMLACRRRGVAVVLGHHSGKGGQQRGTSRRADILDLVLKLTPVTDGPVDGRSRVQVEFEKARDLSPEQKSSFIAVLEPGPEDGLVWSRSAGGIPVGERIQKMLLDGMSPGDIATELGAARSYIYRIRSELIETGELTEANQRRGRKFKGQTTGAGEIVPFPPTLSGGKGTNPRAQSRDRTGDKSGDDEGTRGTDP